MTIFLLEYTFSGPLFIFVPRIYLGNKCLPGFSAGLPFILIYYFSEIQDLVRSALCVCASDNVFLSRVGLCNGAKRGTCSSELHPLGWVGVGVGCPALLDRPLYSHTCSLGSNRDEQETRWWGGRLAILL